MNVKHIVSILLATTLLAIVATANAQEAKPVTVEIFHGNEVWKPGHPLAVCVQTGLREHALTGAHRIEYRFAHRSYEGNETRSTLTELQMSWADTSYMLVDAAGNLVAVATGRVSGKDQEQVEDRAIAGDSLLPGGAEFSRVCGELVDKKLVFVPRESNK